MRIKGQSGGYGGWYALGGVDPGLGLSLVGVLNLCRWVEGWLEILEYASALLALTVDQHIVAAWR